MIDNNDYDNDEILEEIKDCVSDSYNAYKDAREAAHNDSDFDAGKQWPDEYTKDRGNRPSITVNDAPILRRRVMSGWKNARPAIKVNPVDNGSDVETAQVMEGIISAIMRNSMGEIVSDYAVNDMLRCGMGFSEVTTDYCDDESNNQEIKVNRIKDWSSVFLDPDSQAVDYSDMNHGSIIYPVSKRFIKNNYDLDHTEIIPFSNPDYNYSSSSSNAFLCKHYKTFEKADKLIAYYDSEKDEIIYKYKTNLPNYKDLKQSGLILSERPVNRKSIKWFVASDNKIIDSGDWAGSYVPIIPYYGDEYILDGSTLYGSLIRWTKDPARVYNYYITSIAEELAMKPKAAVVALKGQLDGEENEWVNANRNPKGILYFNSVDVNGSPYVQQPGTTSMPDVPAAYLSAGESAKADKISTHGIQNDMMGLQSNAVSGRAIIQRSKDSEESASPLLGNAIHSLKYLGKVLVDLIPKIYDTERVVRILGKDGAQKIIKINSEQPNEDGKIFDVRNGKYDIYVDTGPSFASQRKENAEALTTLLGVLPPEKGTAIAHLAVENMDWEGAKEASRILKRMMPPELLQDDNEDVSKEQIAAQAQSLQGENEQLKAQIDDLNKLLLSNQQKIDADKEMTLFKEQEETKRLLIKNNATLDQIEKKNQGEINKILVEGMAKISDSMSALEHKLTKITGENREEADDAD